jgi:hypothetical protein
MEDNMADKQLRQETKGEDYFRQYRKEKSPLTGLLNFEDRLSWVLGCLVEDMDGGMLDGITNLEDVYNKAGIDYSDYIMEAISDIDATPGWSIGSLACLSNDLCDEANEWLKTA